MKKSILFDILVFILFITLSLLGLKLLLSMSFILIRLIALIILIGLIIYFFRYRGRDQAPK